MERMEFDLLFRWFVGLGIDDPVWDATIFTKKPRPGARGRGGRTRSSPLCWGSRGRSGFCPPSTSRSTDGTGGFIVGSVEAVAAVDRVRSLDRGAVRRYFESRFTVQRMASGYLAAYKALIAAGEHRRHPRLRVVDAEASFPLAAE